MCAILCARDICTLCAGRPSLVANSGLPDDFSQNMSPITPSGNGNVGRGTRTRSEFSFKVAENLPPVKKIAGEISGKNFNNFFGT
jgi:hypothetical protein